MNNMHESGHSAYGDEEKMKTLPAERFSQKFIFVAKYVLFFT